MFGCTVHSQDVKLKPKVSAKSQNPNKSGDSRSDVATEANQSGNDALPSPEAVARKAYFAYVNEGSQPGREVQHWLAAEADLITERNLTRIHGFHNRT